MPYTVELVSDVGLVTPYSLRIHLESKSVDLLVCSVNVDLPRVISGETAGILNRMSVYTFV